MRSIRSFRDELRASLNTARTVAILLGIGFAIGVAPANAQLGTTITLSDGTPVLVQTSGGTSTFTNGCGITASAPAFPFSPPSQLLGCGVGKVTFNSQLTSMARRSAETGSMQSKVRDMRDCLQDRTKPCPGRRRAFAEESVDDSGWLALGYSGRRNPGSPFPVKAAKEPPEVEWSIWGDGEFDYERRTGSQAGIDIGLKTRTFTGNLGVDLSIYNLYSADDGLSFGVYGQGLTETAQDNIGNTARQSSPGVGGYIIYTDGKFSADVNLVAQFQDLQSSAMPGSARVNNYELTSNLYYKVKVNTWWYEPLAGIVLTKSVWDATGHSFGLDDGSGVRLQAGFRYGTDHKWNGMTVTRRWTFLVYDDVLLDDGNDLFKLLSPAVPTDEGKVFGLVQSRLSVEGEKGLSAFVEGEVRGREGVFGIAARAGFNYTFQKPDK